MTLVELWDDANNLKLNCVTETFAAHRDLPSNVELTGAARLYRAASSD